MRPALPWSQSQTKMLPKRGITDQYPWWTWMQKFSSRYYLIRSTSTIKGLFTTNKWDLFPGCKGDSTSTNQLMWCTILTQEGTRTITSSRCRKAFAKILHPFLIKTLHSVEIEGTYLRGAWVSQWLSVCLRLRAWSRRSGIEPRIRLLHWEAASSSPTPPACDPSLAGCLSLC